LATYLPLTDWHYRRILRRWGEHDSAPETTPAPEHRTGAGASESTEPENPA
jgi:hypothetical protein